MLHIVIFFPNLSVMSTHRPSQVEKVLYPLRSITLIVFKQYMTNPPLVEHLSVNA